MTRWTWTDALRKRVLARLEAVLTENDGPGHVTVKDYFAALKAEDMDLCFWRCQMDQFLSWVQDESPRIHHRLIDSVCYEWSEAHDTARAVLNAIAKLSRWNPPGECRRWIDADAVETEADR